MRLDEIPIFFNDCSGEGEFFSSFLRDQTPRPLSPPPSSVLGGVANYILTDVEFLFDKSLINIISAHELAKNGFFSWAAVTSYYSSFFSVQAINRLNVNFITRKPRFLLCQATSGIEGGEVIISTPPSTLENHKIEFSYFNQNVSSVAFSDLLGNYGTLGLSTSGTSSDSDLRNQINYLIDRAHFYELAIEEATYQAIKGANILSPFQNTTNNSLGVNHYNYFMKRAIARLYGVNYFLSLIADYSRYYRSFYENRMRNRIESMNTRFEPMSNWLKDELERSCTLISIS